MGLTRPDPEARRDIQCHQNGKLLLNEKRALKLMGELQHCESPRCFQSHKDYIKVKMSGHTRHKVSDARSLGTTSSHYDGHVERIT